MLQLHNPAGPKHSKLMVFGSERRVAKVDLAKADHR